MTMPRATAMSTKILLIGALALAGLTGCGKQVALKQNAGEPMPVAPLGADASPTADELMTPKPQARPERSDELLRRSEKRKDDPFDLPPPG